MSESNKAQIDLWNGRVGEKWAAMQASLDAMLSHAVAALLARAGSVAGKRVLDIGCGAGEICVAMLAATHTKFAPWTLVDFNDQRAGRLTLIRHLLDSLPDCAVPEEWIDFAPLAGKPATEKFTGPLKPIASVVK